MIEIAHQAAQFLNDIRTQHGGTERLPPELRPTSMAEAYAVQDVAGRRHGVYGWKVGPAKPGEAEPRCALLHGPGPLYAPAELKHSELPRGMAELEIGVTFAQDVALGAGRNAVLAAIGEVHLALEILNSRFYDRAAINDFEGMADHQSAAHIVVASGRSDWDGLALQNLDLTLTINGKEPRVATDTLALAPTLDLVVWLAGHAQGRGFPLRKGTVVITGARVGPFDLAGVHRLDGMAGGLTPVTLEIVS